MVALLRMLPIALALLVAAAGGARSQQVAHPEATDLLPGAAERTYGGLARLVSPAGVRHIGGADMAGSLPLSPGVKRIAALPVRSGGQERTALLLDFGESDDGVSGFVVLALFDTGGEARLLDAANVAFDRYTAFADPARLAAGVGDDLLAIRSTHFNSYQGYATTALILLRDGRIELVDEVSTFDDRTCAWQRSQLLDLGTGAGEPFADIAATVTERMEATGEDCGDEAMPGPPTRRIAVTYRWNADAQRYLPDSDAFAVLAQENEKRF